MMRRSVRYYAVWGLLLAAGFVLLLVAGREIYGRQRARILQDRLLAATTEDVLGIVREMEPYRRWLDESLREAYAEAEANQEARRQLPEASTAAEANQDARRQLHASLALLPVEPGQVGYLCDRVLTANPEELFVIREALQPHAQEAITRLWEVLEDSKRLPGAHLRAACVLAAYGDDERWQGVSREVALRLVAENSLVIAGWAKALRPVRQHLLPT